MSFLEKKVTELENDSLTNGDLKSKLKQENTQLVHRSGCGFGSGCGCDLGTEGCPCCQGPNRSEGSSQLCGSDESAPCSMALPTQGAREHWSLGTGRQAGA